MEQHDETIATRPTTTAALPLKSEGAAGREGGAAPVDRGPGRSPPGHEYLQATLVTVEEDHIKVLSPEMRLGRQSSVDIRDAASLSIACDYPSSRVPCFSP